MTFGGPIVDNKHLKSSFPSSPCGLKLTLRNSTKSKKLRFGLESSKRTIDGLTSMKTWSPSHIEHPYNWCSRLCAKSWGVRENEKDFACYWASLSPEDINTCFLLGSPWIGFYPKKSSETEDEPTERIPTERLTVILRHNIIGQQETGHISLY